MASSEEILFSFKTLTYLLTGFATSIQILPDGETGRVAFDAMGDRINAEYSVVNVQGSKDNREVGTYHFSKVRRHAFSASVFSRLVSTNRRHVSLV